MENSVIILTQPLFEDNHLPTKKSQILLYRNIIDNYASGEKVIIKTHPREKINYSIYFPNCEVINYPFPIEIIDFLPFKIKKVITVSSTSINLLNKVEKKIYLGWEYLKDYK